MALFGGSNDKECRMVHSEVAREPPQPPTFTVPTFDKIVKRGDANSVEACETTDVSSVRDANFSQKNSRWSTISSVESSEGLVDKGAKQVAKQVGGCKTLIIFDYDDTILPTYSLAMTQKPILNCAISPEMAAELEKYSDAVVDNLSRAVAAGTLVIVTNASSEWLLQSCERYLPKVGQFFQAHKIRIISARDRFGSSLLSQKHWKYFIFIDLIEEHFIKQLKAVEPFSVLSVGDGAEERDACIKLAAIFKNASWSFKNLKFLTQPSFACLFQQHVLLARSFQSLLDVKNSVDLCILYDKKSLDTHGGSEAAKVDGNAVGGVNAVNVTNAVGGGEA